jgi:lipid-A-disaccharide synthase
MVAHHTVNGCNLQPGDLLGSGTQSGPAHEEALIVDPSERLDAFAASNAAMAKSGTVTLELALAHVPMVVAYRVSPVSAFLVRRMGVSVEHASLVNLLAGREVVPERIQEDCTPEKLAASVDEILGSESVRASQQQAFKEVTRALGDPTPPPSERAAKVVLDIIG